jgi:hypothetical protein
MSTAQQILLLIAAILALLAAILVPLAVLLSRRTRRAHAQMAAELATEPALRGPEKAVYRGGTAAYPKVDGNGLISLTERRLLFRGARGPAGRRPRRCEGSGGTGWDRRRAGSARPRPPCRPRRRAMDG